MKYLVECLSCHQAVWSNCLDYGDGWVGMCPECKGLAYNRDKLPVNDEEEALHRRVRGARLIH